MDGQNLSWLCGDEAVCFHVEKRAQRIMKYGRSYSELNRYEKIPEKRKSF